MTFDGGTAVVRVLADAKELGQSVTAGVKQAEAGVTASTNQISSVLKGALVGGFAAAGAAALKFGADAVASAAEAEEVQAALQNAVGGSTEAYEHQATALQNLTGFQDEEILKADAVLARFGLTETQLKQLTPLVLDYARATGKDATSAAESIGKALLGNTRALKEVGISYKTTGDVAEDFTSIMELLNEKVGGAAEAFGTTYAGQVAILTAKFDDLKESVGRGLLGPMTTWLQLLEAFLGPQRTAVDTLEEFRAAIDATGGDLEEKLRDQLPQVQAALESMTRAAMQASLAQDDLSGATDLATQAMKEQQAAVKQAAGDLPGLIGAIDRLKEAQKELHKAQKDSTTSQAELRDKSLDVIEAYQGVKDLFNQVVAEYQAGGASMKDVIQHFRDEAEAAGVSKGLIKLLVGELHDYIATLKQVPTSVVTNVRTNYSHQQMAEGGIVTRPTVALIGEAGPEAVIPLNKAGAWARGGDGPMVVIYGDVTGEEVVRKVRDGLLRIGRNNGGTGL